MRDSHLTVDITKLVKVKSYYASMNENGFNLRLKVIALRVPFSCADVGHLIIVVMVLSWNQ